MTQESEDRKQGLELDNTINSIREAINNPALSPERRAELLAQAEEMGKSLTQRAFETSVV